PACLAYDARHPNTGSESSNPGPLGRGTVARWRRAKSSSVSCSPPEAFVITDSVFCPDATDFFLATADNDSAAAAAAATTTTTTQVSTSKGQTN
ncbi:unnamed protein product, partial [Ectocarpus sp. 12 AP-2014]